MKRSDKQELVSDLQNVFKETDTVMVFHYKGLTVADMDSLRAEARKSEIGCKIVKNSLASIAIKDTKNEVLGEFLEGPSAIAWGSDPVSCAKLLSDFAKKNNKLQVIGGSYNGAKLSKADVASLSNLPPFEEIRAKLVGIFVASATKISMIAKTPASNLVGVLEAFSKKS